MLHHDDDNEHHRNDSLCQAITIGVNDCWDSFCCSLWYRLSPTSSFDSLSTRVRPISLSSAFYLHVSAANPIFVSLCSTNAQFLCNSCPHTVQINEGLFPPTSTQNVLVQQGPPPIITCWRPIGVRWPSNGRVTMIDLFHYSGSEISEYIHIVANLHRNHFPKFKLFTYINEKVPVPRLRTLILLRNKSTFNMVWLQIKMINLIKVSKS